METRAEIGAITMKWEQVKQHFSGDPDESIEIYYENMTEASWRSVFDWIDNQPGILVMNAYGYIEPEELDCEEFIAGNTGYVVTTRSKADLEFSLNIIDDDTMDCYVYPSEIQGEDSFNDFMSLVNELAEITHSPRVIICPEEQKAKAFIVNGEMIR